MRSKFVFLTMVVLAGCRATGSSSSDSGNTTTTFQNPTNLQIAATDISGIGTPTELLIGKFTNDAYPDIIELTSTGAYFIKNESGSSWTLPSSAIAATASAPFTVGIARDFSGDTNHIYDLILASTSGSKILSFLENDGTGTFTQVDTLGVSDVVESLAFAPIAATPTLGFLMASVSVGNHFRVPISTALTFGVRANQTDAAIAPASGVKFLAGDLMADNIYHFVLVPSSGLETIQIFKNTANTSVDAFATISRVPTTDILSAQLANLSRTDVPDLILGTSAGIELYKNDKDSSDFSFTVDTILKPSALSTAATSFVFDDFTLDDLSDFFMTVSSAKSKFYSASGTRTYRDTTSTAFGSLLVTSPLKTYEADIDANGAPDIIELYSTGRIVVHINNAVVP